MTGEEPRARRAPRRAAACRQFTPCRDDAAHRGHRRRRTPRPPSHAATRRSRCGVTGDAAVARRDRRRSRAAPMRRRSSTPKRRSPPRPSTAASSRRAGRRSRAESPSPRRRAVELRRPRRQRRSDDSGSPSARAAPEPEIEFSQTEKPAEDRARGQDREGPHLGRRHGRARGAAQARHAARPPKRRKRDVLADLDSLRPKRDINRTLHLQLPPDVLSRTKSVRVTLSFEDGEQAVIDTQDQQLELGDTSDVQCLSVNLKIDLANRPPRPGCEGGAMRNTLLLAGVALYAVACASSAPLPTVAPAAPRRRRSPRRSTPTRSAASSKTPTPRSSPAPTIKTPPADAPVVDLEAAASIPIPEHRTINSAVRLFSVDMKDSIQTSLLRSARYRKLIDKALAEQKLPKGLAYLPVIESAYMPTLTSRAGAHGIWQFMPDTAREYGLRVDWWVDERADPERSTRAAADVSERPPPDVRRLVARAGRVQLRPGPRAPHARRSRARRRSGSCSTAVSCRKRRAATCRRSTPRCSSPAIPRPTASRLGEPLEHRREARRRARPGLARVHRRGHRRRRGAAARR